MAIAVYFNPEKMTLAKFNETHRRLTEAGAANPAGRIHHSCFGADGELMVYDIWESQEAFEAFGATLGPILAEVGINAGDPMVMPIVRLDQTAASQA
jgi:hypothetical protein